MIVFSIAFTAFVLLALNLIANRNTGIGPRKKVPLKIRLAVWIAGAAMVGFSLWMMP